MLNENDACNVLLCITFTYILRGWALILNPDILHPSTTVNPARLPHSAMCVSLLGAFAQAHKRLLPSSRPYKSVRLQLDGFLSMTLEIMDLNDLSRKSKFG
jgi:hypothetical protein